MARRNQPEQQEEEKKGVLGRLFGRNKRFSMMLIFYIIIAGLIWFYFYLTRSAEQYREKRSFNFPEDRSVVVRLIDSETRHGINVSFDNQGDADWEIENFYYAVDSVTNQTNLTLFLSPGSFDAYFIELPQSVTDISGISVDL